MHQETNYRKKMEQNRSLKLKIALKMSNHKIFVYILHKVYVQLWNQILSRHLTIYSTRIIEKDNITQHHVL